VRSSGHRDEATQEEVSRTARASARVRAEWQRRVHVEYRSAALTQHLTLWLLQVGASPDLIREGLVIVDDELAHAELSHLVALEAGGAASTIDRAQLVLGRDESVPLEHDLVRACVGVFCLGETAAVPIFRGLREACTVPVARRALDRVLRDEVRHRDFGWRLLGWLIERPDGARVRCFVEAELPAMFAALRETYSPPGSEKRSDWKRCFGAERAWGLMPMVMYRDAVERALERDFVPRFGKLQIAARRAWAAV